MRALLLTLALLVTPLAAQESPTFHFKPNVHLLSVFAMGERMFMVVATSNADGSRDIDIVDLSTGNIILTIVEGGKAANKKPVKR